MTLLLQTALISHVMLGLVGVMAFYAVWLGLLKREPSIPFLKGASLFAFLGIILSWISGGYYYVVYYGSVTKPIIVGGAYPWAHFIFTETKEHVFLVLPFAALVLVALFFVGGGRLLMDPNTKQGAVWLAAALTILGTFITFAGIVISGGAQ